MALRIPIPIMERLYGKHSENPMMALNRVYRYWLADKNSLSPTWEKLISALKEIKEFTVATNVKQHLKVSLAT